MEFWDRFFQAVVRESGGGASPLVVLVGSNPMRAHVRDEHYRRFGARLGLHTLTFADLAERLVGGEAAPLAGTVLTRALATRILREHRAAYFNATRPFEGTAGALLGVFDDFMEAGWSDAPVARGDGEKLVAIAEMYASFTRALRELGRTTPSWMLGDAAVRADRFEAVFGSRALHVVGIYDVNAVQRDLLAALAETISVHYHAPRVPHPSTTMLALGARIERARPFEADMALTSIVSCPSPIEEAREIARRARRYRAEGVPWSRMAVAARHGETYRDLLADVLVESGVPCRVYGRLTPRRSPALRSLVALADMIADPVGRDGDKPRLGRRATMAWLLSAPWKNGVAHDRRRWNALTRALMIRRGEDWRVLDEAATDLDVDEARTVGVERLTRADRRAAARLRDAVRTLERCLSDVRNAKSHSLAATALASWADESLELDENAACAMESLSALAEADAAGLAYTPAFFAARARDILAAVEDRTRGADAEGVCVMDTASARGVPFDVVMIPGCAEGALPYVGREEPILTDADRRTLNARRKERPLPLFALRAQNERNAFDVTVRGASRSLVLTWARRDDAIGRAVSPSHYALSLFGSTLSLDALRAHKSYSEVLDPTQAEPIDRETRDLAALAALRRESPRAAFAYALSTQPGFARAAYRWESRASKAIGAFEGRFESDAGKAAAAAWLGARDRVRVTEIEDFFKCPRRYLYGRVLELERPDEPENVASLGADRKGTLVHDVMAAWATGEIPEDGWEARVRADYARLASARLTGGGALDEAERERLRTAVEALTAFSKARSGGRATEHAEARLEDLGAAVALDAGGRALSGRVDRWDRDGANGEVVLIDYKTGKAAHPLATKKNAALDDDSLNNGATAQLALYAWALERSGVAAKVATEYWFLKNADGEVDPTPVVTGSETHALLGPDIERAVVSALEDVRLGRFAPRPDVAAVESVYCGHCPYARICDGVSRRNAASAKPEEDPAWLDVAGRLADSASADENEEGSGGAS